MMDLGFLTPQPSLICRIQKYLRSRQNQCLLWSINTTYRSCLVIDLSARLCEKALALCCPSTSDQITSDTYRLKIVTTSDRPILTNDKLRLYCSCKDRGWQELWCVQWRRCLRRSSLTYRASCSIKIMIPSRGQTCRDSGSHKLMLRLRLSKRLSIDVTRKLISLTMQTP